MKNINSGHTQNGNALWFILIAIVLLGAITMILSRGSSSVDQSGDVEHARIKAGQIMRYAKGIEAAVQQMVLRGVSENDISFENSVTATDYTNGNCSVEECMVFARGGGGLTYLDPIDGVNDGSDWIFTGANNVGTGAGPIGTTAAASGNDLVMLLPEAKTGFCEQINRDLDVGTPGTLPEDADGIDTTEFTGTYTGGGPVIINVDDAPAGCFTDTNAAPDVTYFYYVILAR